MQKLPREFYNRETRIVAQELLGCHLVHRLHGVEQVGKIVEVEAYLGQHDLASHASKGLTKRTATMFGPPGHAYVYLIYGLYHCFNVVTEPAGIGSAVLIRAIEPIANITGRTQGPGLLCQSMMLINFYPNKLLDYRGQEDALAANNNPFAWVTLVQLASIGSRQDTQYRYQQKSALTRYLYTKKYSNEDIRALYTFIDWVLTLSEHLEIRYNEEIKQFEEEHHMRYITSIERQGMQQGLQQGKHEEALLIAKNMLSKGFEQDIIQELTGLTVKDIAELDE